MQIYPLDFPIQADHLEKYPKFFCLICGQDSQLVINNPDNLREDCLCQYCYSTNRQRQMAYLFLQSIFGYPSINESINNLSDIDQNIHNTESSGALHQYLKINCQNYSCSEYFGSQYQSGEMVNGVMHQDLMNISFSANSLDYLLSSDVFEHIPDPYQAFKEIHRVLRPGGKHIFTVPFHQTLFEDDIRAKIENGQIIHLHDPIYHGDPVRPEGILVYTIFSLEMLVKLSRLGFVTKMHRLYAPQFGIWGDNAVIFESIKNNSL